MSGDDRHGPSRNGHPLAGLGPRAQDQGTSEAAETPPRVHDRAHEEAQAPPEMRSAGPGEPGAPPGAPTRRTAAAVRFERLELRGFGRHDDLALTLPAGFGTLVRPNEWGKSTVVAGLSAVLFGLPANEDATAFGSGRYRPWERGGGFEARLTFRATDGARYRLERRFEDHAVRLSRLEDGGDEVVLDGTHNPRARRRNERFDEALAELVGVRSREAFEEVFCVAQPLPAAERLADEVQRLLVGAGRGRVDAALGDLAAGVAARTRRTGQLGVTPGDRRKDGALEAVEARIAALRERRAGARDAADRAQTVGRALSEAEEQRRRHDAEASEVQAGLDARRAFLEHLRGYDERRAAQRDAERALTQAETLNAEAEEARARLAREWPEFTDADEGTESALERLVETERAVRAAGAALDDAREASDRARRALEEAERQDQRHARQRPAAPEEGERPADVRRLRADAERALREWREHLARDAALSEARVALEPYGAFLRAPEADGALLRRYELEAAGRVQAVEAREAAVREARAERRRLLVPDPALPTEAEADAIRALLERPDRRGRRVVLQLLLSAALAVLVFLLVREAAPVLWAAGAGVLAGLGVAALARPGSPGGRALARYRGATRARLVALLADYDAWVARPVPSRQDLRRLELEVDEARLALERFQQRMRPYQEAFAEPGDAYQAFLDAQREVAQRRALHAELSQRSFGAAPDAVAGRSPADLPDPWPRLAAFARRHGGGADTLASLCRALRGWDAAQWDRLIAAAEAARADLERWQAEAERLRREVARSRTVLEEREATRSQREADHAQAQRERLEAGEPLRDLLDGADGEGEALLQRWYAREEGIEAAERAWDQLATLLDGLALGSIEALRDRVTRRRTETLAAYQALRQLNDEHPELPAPEEAQREAIAERMAALQERLRLAHGARQAAEERVFELTRQRADLQGTPVANVAQLDEELARLEGRRADLRREVAALALAHQELEAAVHDFQAGYRERLEARATRYLQDFTGVAGRRVRLVDGFEVRVLEPAGNEIRAPQLSQGAQDQLLMALRLAIADHIADDAPVPLVLDDPFLNWDAERLERVRAILERIAGERQVVLLSHRPIFAAWGTPLASGA